MMVVYACALWWISYSVLFAVVWMLNVRVGEYRCGYCVPANGFWSKGLCNNNNDISSSGSNGTGIKTKLGNQKCVLFYCRIHVRDCECVFVCESKCTCMRQLKQNDWIFCTPRFTSVPSSHVPHLSVHSVNTLSCFIHLLIPCHSFVRFIRPIILSCLMLYVRVLFYFSFPNFAIVDARCNVCRADCRSCFVAKAIFGWFGTFFLSFCFFSLSDFSISGHNHIISSSSIVIASHLNSIKSITVWYFFDIFLLLPTSHSPARPVSFIFMLHILYVSFHLSEFGFSFNNIYPLFSLLSFLHFFLQKMLTQTYTIHIYVDRVS